MKRKYQNSFFLVLIAISFPSCSSLSIGKYSDNPKDSKIITSDIKNFYVAFEMAIKDTANAKSVFTEHYFKPGTKGLKDFQELKIKSTKDFSDFVIFFREYYQAIKMGIVDISDLKNRIYKNFEEFEKLYSEARFPDVYFVVGNYRSNGTLSKNGLLIGTEILARTPESDTSQWNKDILRISMPRAHIPVTVSHELVHFNQEKMKKGKTLLWKSLREGSAEFIAELISGNTDANFEKFKGREVEVWKDFQKDKNKNIWRSWQQESELRPENAGYWAGYIICRAYFDQIKNKEKAIEDILSIQDYEKFYNLSKVDAYIKRMYGD